MRFNIRDIKQTGGTINPMTGRAYRANEIVHANDANTGASTGLSTPVDYYNTNSLTNNSLRAYQNGGRMRTLDDIVTSYQKNGWDSLSPEEQNWYRSNYGNIARVDQSGDAQVLGEDLPVIEVRAARPGKFNIPANYGSAYSQQGMDKVARELYSQPLQMMGVTGALAGEVVKGIAGRGFNPMNALPSMLNPNSSYYGGDQGQTSVSRELGVENPIGAFAIDAITDPGLLLGASRYIIPKGRDINFIPKKLPNSEFDIESINNAIDFRYGDNDVTEAIAAAWERKSNINKNLSNITKEEALLFVKDDVAKAKIANMTDEEFANTYAKPDNTIVEKSDVHTADNITDTSVDEWVKEFNSNLPRLNEIIAKRNKSGTPYEIIEVDGLRNDIALKTPYRTHRFNVGIIPGKFTGDVEDIANPDYYKNIPGINMEYAMDALRDASGHRLRGTRIYESLNDYLKELKLGRVKPGFNSQTNASFGLWEKAVKEGKAHGFYKSPTLIYGAMKSLLPVTGAGIAGYSAANRPQEAYGGRVGGVNNIPIARTRAELYTGLKDNSKNSMYFPNSNQMTMKGMTTPVKYYGVTDGKITDEGVAYPGQDFNVNGQDTVEFRMPTYSDGGIYIKPSKRGTFTAAAKRHGAGVQEFASRVLANKDNYSPATVKKAVFASNSSKWNR